MSTPYFWTQPLRYLRYASHTSPALLWSVALGAAGPAVLFAAIPAKRVLGIADRPPIPQTYPVPNRPRSIPSGFDDE